MVLAFLWILAVTQLEASSVRTGVTCTLNGRSYEVGETWHQTLDPLQTSSKPCINCTCDEFGKINCVSEKCPRPECEVPITLPDQCCPTCEVQALDGDGTVTPSPGCNVDGEIYEDGALFPSESTGVKKTHENQCVMCVCSTGRVLCHLKTCENYGKCKKYTNVSDDCCPQCEEERGNKDYLHIILSGGTHENLSKSDCVSAIGVKKNGETWHPLIAVFGIDKCIDCHCKEGKVTCKRKQCEPEEKLSCRKPVQVEGDCCKSCPKTKKNRKRDCKRRKGKDGKKRRKCNGKGGQKRNKHNKNTSQPANPPPTTSLPVTGQSVYDSMCLPRRGDRYVYQIEERRSTVLMFDVPSENTVEILRWTLKKGRLSEMEKETKPTEEVRAGLLRAHVLGATNKRNFKKFKRKLRKKLSRCKTSCRRKVISGCIKRLKIKSVKFGKACKRN